MSTLVSKFLRYVHIAPLVPQEQLQMETALPAQSNLQEKVTSSAQTALKPLAEDTSLKRTIAEVSDIVPADLAGQVAKVQKNESVIRAAKANPEVKESTSQVLGQEQIARIQSAAGIVAPPQSHLVEVIAIPQVEEKAPVAKALELEHPTFEKVKSDLLIWFPVWHEDAIKALDGLYWIVHRRILNRDVESLQKEVSTAKGREALIDVLERGKQTLTAKEKYITSEGAVARLKEGFDMLDKSLKALQNFS